MADTSPHLFWDILDQKRKDCLPLFAHFKHDYYLAGGTGLALQLGHRDSFDFDLFCNKSINTHTLFDQVKDVFQGHCITKTQEEKDTLTVTIDESIKISFFSYPYILVNTVVETDNFRLASIADIGCMKLSAITSRSMLKDYVDIYYILQTIPLAELLTLTQKKLPAIDVNLILKSLVYFDDVEIEPIMFKHHDEVGFEKIKEFLNHTVKYYLSHTG